MPEKERETNWNMHAIDAVIGSTGEHTSDAALGDGTRHRMGTGSLEVYPGSASLRIAMENARIELFRLRPPEIEGQTVVFESFLAKKMVRLSLAAHGEVLLEVVPPLAVVKGDLTTDDRQDVAGSSEQERVSLVGRIGATPSFRTTQKGIVVARFPLAVHDDDDTVWHTIVAFGDRAEKIRSTVHKGDMVQVVGYVHEREHRPRNGEPRLLKEIYAARVAPRQVPRP